MPSSVLVGINFSKLLVKTDEHQPPSVPLNTTFFSHINVKQITLRAGVDFTPLTTVQASVGLAD